MVLIATSMVMAVIIVTAFGHAEATPIYAVEIDL